VNGSAGAAEPRALRDRSFAAVRALFLFSVSLQALGATGMSARTADAGLRDVSSARGGRAHAWRGDGAGAPSSASSDSAARDTTRAKSPSLVHSGERTEGEPITTIRIVPRNIFEPLPEGKLRPVFNLANRLHMKTRERTVREQLLFDEGAPWRESAARETERNLRQLNYLNPYRIEASRHEDSVIVTVVTQDVWSTSVEFNLESADQKQYGSVALTESNLLGLGKSVAFLYREDAGGISRSVSVDDPSAFGTRWRIRYGAGKGGSGSYDLVSAGVPFYAEETPYSYGASWSRSSSVIRLHQDDAEIAQIAQTRDDAEVYWGTGRRENGRVRRLMFAFAFQDRALGETMPDPKLPPDIVPFELLGGSESLKLRRLETEGRWWRPHFVERINVDRMNSIEDFDLGRSIALRLGWSPVFLGSSAEEGFARLRLDAGAETSLGYGYLRGICSSRYRSSPSEVVAQVDGRWINQTLRDQTLVLAASGVLGSHVGRDFQASVGGLSGLRAYPVHAVAGRRLVRLNLEDRWFFFESLFGNASLGAVAFTDMARAWGAGSGSGGWFVGSGVGLRLSLPRWSPDHVLRVDLAWPIDPARDGKHSPVLSFGSSQAF
jgi:hypothetical protein